MTPRRRSSSYDSDMASQTGKGAHSAQKTIVNLKAIIFMVVSLVAGVALLFLSSDDARWSLAVRTFLGQLGGTLVAGTALALFWELWGKRAFADELITKMNLSSDLEKAGLVEVLHDYKEVRWDAHFESAVQLDIAFAYGRTWRNFHNSKIEELAKRSGATIRVVLPDADDSLVMSTLAIRFDMTVPDLKKAVREAAQFFLDLSAHGATVEVRFRTGDYMFSSYRIGSAIVLALYAHGRVRQSVPTLVCKEGGELFDFARQDFEAMIKNSRVISTSTETAVNKGSKK
jgi:hypothetical protein